MRSMARSSPGPSDCSTDSVDVEGVEGEAVGKVRLTIFSIASESCAEPAARIGDGGKALARPRRWATRDMLLGFCLWLGRVTRE